MKPLARYAALNGYLELSRSVDLDPLPLMRAVGLDPAGIGVPDRWIPAAAIVELLERSAAISGQDDFGLRLVERRRFSNLGPVSLVIREEPDIRSALKFLMRYQLMYNEALRMRLSESDGVATIHIGTDLGEPAESRQATELAVGVLYRLLRDFVHPGWQPVAVCFAHTASADRSTYLRVFGRMVKFEQEFNGILMYSTELDSPNRMSDPDLRPYARRFLDSLDAPTGVASTLKRVRELIELLLPTGRCSLEQVARSLGVDRRTVHRHLADSGETFSSVLNSTRVECAERMVANQRYSLTEIAELLAFSSPSNFSRWFRGQFGCSPRQWRNQRKAVPSGR
jgi:AraC-like DNA-binding protein